MKLHLDKRTVKLTLSYLVVIMLLSTLFSIAIYYTAATKLHTDFQINILPDSPLQYPVASPLHENKFDNIRHGLLITLLQLNIAVAISGLVISYYLARMSLRPIEKTLAIQDRFAIDAAHELRTPLTVMRMEIEVALRRRPFDEIRVQLALTNTIEHIKLLQKLSNQLLQLSSQHTYKEHKEVNIYLLIHEVIDQFTSNARQKHIDIEDHASPSLIIHTASDNIRQIVAILLDNAIKYSSPYSKVIVSAHVDKTRFIINIIDHGQGIAPEDLIHIFERFYRTRQAKQNNQEGYGIGLSIAQRYARQLKGDITVQSKLQKGSTFSLRIPLY
jgi:two-component system, OmpR family, sensor histidine kinase CiaH